MLLASCSQPNENPLLGKWLLQKTDADTVSNFITFQTENGNPVFTDNSLTKKGITGTWLKSGDTLLLSFIEAKTYAVDSVELKSTGTVLEATYFQNKKPVALGQNGIINPIAKTETALIKQLEDRTLELQHRGNSYVYLKEIKELQSISFMSIFRGIIGIMFLILLTFVFSGNKKKIDWPLVAKGVALQIIIALLVLKVPFIEQAFNVVSQKFVQLISYTDEGVNFLFGQFGLGVVQAPLLTFAVKVLPTIIFFSALMSALYYIGVLQKVVYAFAWVMKKTMRLSGAESLVTAGNIFLGQTESPLLVKPYLMGMTKSEIMCLMTGGMATIAGGVLAAYVGFLGDGDPVQQAFFAKHLLTASIISAPAAIVASKILVPETEEINQDLKVNKEKLGTNLLEAISNGTSDGLKLAVNVGAMLLVFIALMALFNGVLGWVGDITNLNASIAAHTPYQDGLSFQFILGYVGAPIVWMVGVDAVDMVAVGELLGQKTVLNEFIAYPRLGEMNEAGQISEKSVVIATYMLCGFANFASIGIQIGGIGSLIPSRKGLLSSLGMKALLGGTVASLLTAAVVGMLY